MEGIQAGAKNRTLLRDTVAGGFTIGPGVYPRQKPQAPLRRALAKSYGEMGKAIKASHQSSGGGRMQTVQQPIPASMYDADYFEGRTSNYINGYSWDIFGDLFTMTARLLVWMFPDATRYLDFGCATGLLVRALREQGKEAWGVEHSPYCLAHAEAEAKPYLVEDSVVGDGTNL